MTNDYKSAGVNIDEGNRAVDLIKPLVAQTHTPNVLNGLGSFAGFFEIPKGYDNPVLVSCTDGVGTKLKIAIETGILDTIGIDLVAMCVNDLICCGAKPLYFLDYIACNALVPEDVAAIMRGMSQACTACDTAIIGGEMAEMGNVYQPGEFDLAGFSVGIVEKDQIIDGSKIEAGHNIYALPSSGAHSNGFSLLRKVMTDEVLSKHGLSKQDLLTPTRLYVTEILDLVAKHDIRGIAHITGGGLIENVERILPAGLTLDVDVSRVPTPQIFDIVHSEGDIHLDEMARVFNMGIGMVVITPETLAESDELIRIGIVTG